MDMIFVIIVSSFLIWRAIQDDPPPMPEHRRNTVKNRFEARERRRLKAKFYEEELRKREAADLIGAVLPVINNDK